jgi:hypothetical protein
MIGIGDRVLHRKYGSGTVLAVEDDRILTVRFDAAKACCRIVRAFVIRWGEAKVPLSGQLPYSWARQHNNGELRCGGIT